MNCDQLIILLGLYAGKKDICSHFSTFRSDLMTLKERGYVKISLETLEFQLTEKGTDTVQAILSLVS